MSYLLERMVTCLCYQPCSSVWTSVFAALSEVRRPDCGEIMAGGYTYYWSGSSDGYHAQGVALAVSNKLTPMIIEVAPVNERIMRRRIRHSLSVISVVSVYAPTEASDLTVKDAFYATLESGVDQCPRQDTLLVLGDFIASIGTDGDGYEMCWFPWVCNCEPE